MVFTLAIMKSSGFLPVETPKSLVQAAPVDNEETIHHRNVEACQTIRNYPGIFGRMRRSMMRRVEACIESHGGHFEHLLQMYSRVKCFRTHVDMDILSCFGMWNWCPKFIPKFQAHPYKNCIFQHCELECLL
jgi:hypothetical protein